MNHEPVTAFLEQHFAETLEAGFIYGSLAAGHAGPTSDVDCFVITGDDFDIAQRCQVGMAFADLQRQLGFTPDKNYPIEIFSAGACRSILQGGELNRVLEAAGRAGALERSMDESDEVEVLRALIDRRLVLRCSPVLDELTSLAQELGRRHSVELLCVPGTVGVSLPTR
ncbi:nucleotidyltransferase domain-containing protein [Mangrovihabitans endophyticus]|uniref:Polymerase nucleotidyl transferase domain-containing protein n=1 Tax=Mangrovihabitans endophyticus TaxID=1751298 RepID=A0A8J3FLY4_9ACTN|nr:nucleotidyltransferase domain-containing protein [Mangrovihabitans endophyticus]GGK72418.1 hypothetical protein GCM10012284_02780 [Mangrovihabitans endophyticus]